MLIDVLNKVQYRRVASVSVSVSVIAKTVITVRRGFVSAETENVVSAAVSVTAVTGKMVPVGLRGFRGFPTIRFRAGLRQRTVDDCHVTRMNELTMLTHTCDMALNVHLANSIDMAHHERRARSLHGVICVYCSNQINL